jgi:DNA-binding protein YbaB
MTPGPGDRFDHLLKGMKSRVESLDTIVETEESRVDTQESKAQLGELEEVDPRVKSLDAIVETEESRVDIPDSIVKSLDNTALEEAIKEASKKPKLGVYSPLAAAMLRYKAITTPRYSMGSELRIVIEQALKEAYPQLYDEVQKRMREGQS